MEAPKVTGYTLGLYREKLVVPKLLGYILGLYRNNEKENGLLPKF